MRRISKYVRKKDENTKRYNICHLKKGYTRTLMFEVRKSPEGQKILEKCAFGR